jgi:hypothetical protein
MEYKMINVKMQLIKETNKNNNNIKTYKLIDTGGYLDDIITKNYNIKFDEIYYFGTFQGYKIYLDNKKYPIKKGYFYTNHNLIKAISKAIKEKTSIKLNDYFIENQNVLFNNKQQ